MIAAIVGAAGLAVGGATLAFAGSSNGLFDWTPTAPTVSDAVTFTNSYTAVDPTDDVLYHWDFGDGSPASTDPNPTHAFQTATGYTVTLDVTDIYSGTTTTTSDTGTVDVAPLPDVHAVISGPDSGSTGEPLTFDGSGSTGPVSRWSWKVDGAPVDLPSSSSLDWTFTEAGSHTVTLTVTDRSENTDSVDWPVEISDASGGGGGPVDDSYVSSPPGATLTVGAESGVLANDTPSASQGRSIHASPFEAETTEQGGHASLAQDGSFVYTPKNNIFIGSDSFTYKTTDGDVQAGPATVTIDVQGIVARPDESSTPVNTATAVDVLANDDSNPDGSLTAQIVDQPAHGTAAANDSGTISYQPAEDFTGDDSFTYRAHRGDFTSNVATVTVHVLPDESNAPPNDDQANATVLTPANQGMVNGTTIDATFARGEVDPTGTGLVGNTVWYAWTPPSSGIATLVLDPGFVASLAVYTEPVNVDHVVAHTTGSQISDESQAPNLQFPVTQGTRYLIQVGTNEDDPYVFTLQWTVPQPAHDNLADALGISGATGTSTGSNLGATVQSGEPTTLVAADEPWADSIWWTWTAPSSGSFTFDTYGSPAEDTTLGVWTGADFAHFSEVTSDDDTDADIENDLNSIVTFDAVQGTTYRIGVGSYNGNLDEEGGIILNWAPTGAGGPPNDSFSHPDALEGDNGSLGPASNVGATVQPGEPDAADAGSDLGNTVWYSWSPSRAGRATINLDADFSAAFAVYRAVLDGSDVTFEPVDSDSDSGSLTLSFDAQVDTQYYIQVGTFDDSPATFSLDWALVPTNVERRITGRVLDHGGQGLGGIRVQACLGAQCLETLSSEDGDYEFDHLAPGDWVVRAYTANSVASQGRHADTTDSDQTVDVVFTDPSGNVVDQNGAAVQGATVTLLDADGSTPIPANDPRLADDSRVNPETSDGGGAWGWNVAPGTYYVRAEKSGCSSDISGPLTVTPTDPVTGVVLTISCGTITPPSGGGSSGGGSVSGLPPFNPPSGPALPPPVKDETVNVVLTLGTILVNGVPLPAGEQIPFGAIVDATNGIVQLTTIGPTGEVQTMYFMGAVFKITQGVDGVTELELEDGDFSVCTKSHRKTQASLAKKGAKVIRSLWGQGKGAFRTKGRYSAATVRGTLWLTQDRCDGTVTRVDQGVVNVLDLVRNKTIVVLAGHSVLVRPK